VALQSSPYDYDITFSVFTSPPHVALQSSDGSSLQQRRRRLLTPTKATTATQARVVAVAGTDAPGTSSQHQVYARTRKRLKNAGGQDLGDEDDNNQQEDPQEDNPAAAEMDENKSESIEAESARDAFQIDPNLLYV
jgi:hypothetical protein